MSMISNAVITGGAFSSINDHRQVYVNQTHKSALDRLQECVAHKAFHNSGEQYNRPKCHPNTRVAVRDRIEKWALRTDPDTMDASIMWLSGAAGAGKSAIAQTVAEDFHSRGLLIASFFFGRTDPTRNHAQSLVATIVYQLYTFLPPPEQERLLAVIERDPLIFTKSLLVQFEALIVTPLQLLIANGVWSSNTAPRLIIIDGLDECLDHGMQRNVLLLLSASVQQFHLPLLFLLASRPEHDIQAVFGCPDFIPLHTRLFLDNTYRPYDDIKLFLCDQFQECRTGHPFRHLIPPNWPSAEIVDEITKKSSGQFIYASVVAKYIKSSRHRPDHRLEIVLNLRAASRDLPFSELDALYTHLFSIVEDIERVLDIISFHIIMKDSLIFLDQIESILQLGPGEAVISLCDLSSIIAFQPNEHGRLELVLLHASLADYLLDRARSKDCFMDLDKYRTQHVTASFQLLSHVQRKHYDEYAFVAVNCFSQNRFSLKLSEPLYHAIRGFSISQSYDSLTMKTEEEANFAKVVISRSDFLPFLSKFLKEMESPEYLKLYQHHQPQYDLFLRETMKTYWSWTPIPLFLALVAFHHKMPNSTYDRQFILIDKSQVDDRAMVLFLPGNITYHGSRDYLEYLSDFLWDAKRSQEFCAGPNLFAHAAKHCLLYLCNHTAFAQKAPPRMSAKLRTRRRHTPWKWLRRVLQEDIQGPHDAPWLWLRPAAYYPSFSTCVFHRKTNDLIYARRGCPQAIIPTCFEDPVILHRIHSERYHLVLKYLNNFLPRAAKLDELVHMCQTLTLASRSQDFPRKSARARSNMHEYATQCG